MPFALVIFGLVMIVTGVKGTIKPLGNQLVKDFTGPGNFFYWFAAIGAVGASGAIPGFKNFSRMFMTLIIVAMVIHNGGVFDQLINAIKTGPVAPPKGTASSDPREQGALIGALAPIGDIGSAALRGVQQTASQSITTSGQQQSNPAANVSALTKLIGLFM